MAKIPDKGRAFTSSSAVGHLKEGGKGEPQEPYNLWYYQPILWIKTLMVSPPLTEALLR